MATAWDPLDGRGGRPVGNERDEFGSLSAAVMSFAGGGPLRAVLKSIGHSIAALTGAELVVVRAPGADADLVAVAVAGDSDGLAAELEGSRAPLWLADGERVVDVRDGGRSPCRRAGRRSGRSALGGDRPGFWVR